MVKIDINNIPEHFKQFDFYKFAMEEYEETDTIVIDQRFTNFDETVKDYNDLKRIINLYKYWMAPDKMFFNLIYKNKRLIQKNIKDFIEFINDFELSQLFITLLKPIENIQDYLIENNYEDIFEYLCEKKLLNLQSINKTIVKRLNLVKILRKNNYNVSFENLLEYGIKLNDLESMNYLEFLIENYKEKMTKKRHRLIYFCCLHKKNNWIFYLLESKNFKFENISYENLYEWGYKFSNEELMLKLVMDNYINTDSIDKKIELIRDAFTNFLTSYVNTTPKSKNIFNFDKDGNKSANYSKLLTYLFTNKVDLNYFVPEEYIADNDDLNMHGYSAIGSIDDWFDNNNLTLSKYLQLIFLYTNNKFLLYWLVENGIEKSSALLNRAIHWLNDDETIIWMCKNGFNPDENTLMCAINSKYVLLVEYFISRGYKLTYKKLDLIYNLMLMCSCNYLAEDGTILLKYLIPNKDYKIDNRYIIRSLENYKIFCIFYENYPEITNFLTRNDKYYDIMVKYINMYENKIKTNDEIKYDDHYYNDYEDDNEEIEHKFTDNKIEHKFTDKQILKTNNNIYSDYDYHIVLRLERKNKISILNNEDIFETQINKKQRFEIIGDYHTIYKCNYDTDDNDDNDETDGNIVDY